MQNANVSTRSGGNQPVRTPSGTATSVKASQRHQEPPREPAAVQGAGHVEHACS